MASTHTPEWKAWLEKDDGAGAWSGGTYYQSAEAAMAGAERSAQRKADKYGRAYTACTVQVRGAGGTFAERKTTGRRFEPQAATPAGEEPTMPADSTTQPNRVQLEANEMARERYGEPLPMGSPVQGRCVTMNTQHEGSVLEAYWPTWPGGFGWHYVVRCTDGQDRRMAVVEPHEPTTREDMVRLMHQGGAEGDRARDWLRQHPEHPTAITGVELYSWANGWSPRHVDGEPGHVWCDYEGVPISYGRYDEAQAFVAGVRFATGITRVYDPSGRPLLPDYGGRAHAEPTTFVRPADGAQVHATGGHQMRGERQA